VDREARASFWVVRVNRWFLLGAVGLLGLALLLPIRLLPLSDASRPGSRIAQGVILWGRDFSGKSEAEARQTLQALAQELERAPVNAQRVQASDGLSYVVPEQDGWELDVERTLFRLTAAGPGGLVQPVLNRLSADRRLAHYPDAIIRQAGSTREELALLINVDWGEKELGQMLPILREKKAHVTFFVSGRWAEKNAALLRQMSADGHEIASHGHDLTYGPKDLLRTGRLKADIQQSVTTIEGITKQPIRYWAPHMSEVSPEIVKTATTLQLRTVLYSVDTIDWRDSTTPAEVMRKIGSAKAGDLILLHPKPLTVNLLPELLQKLQQNGLQPVTLTELLAGGGAAPAETVVPMEGH
jgi:hypothetical protein